MTLALFGMLLVVVGVLAWRALTRERREYSRFRKLRTTVARQRIYRRWLTESALLLGGLSIAVLVAAWPFVPQALRDTRGWAPIAWLLERFDALATPVQAIIGVALVVLIAAALIAPVIMLRGKVDEVPTVGDIGPLLPRTRAELKWGAGLGLNAGIVEELLFRLAIPALLFGITGSGPLAFGLAALLFGLLHLYQGLVGVVATTIVGLLLTAVYVLTGSILWPIALHALIDLRAFVLIPIALQGVWRVRGEAPRPVRAPRTPEPPTPPAAPADPEPAT